MRVSFGCTVCTEQRSEILRHPGGVFLPKVGDPQGMLHYKGVDHFFHPFDGKKTPLDPNALPKSLPGSGKGWAPAWGTWPPGRPGGTPQRRPSEIRRVDQTSGRSRGLPVALVVLRMFALPSLFLLLLLLFGGRGGVESPTSGLFVAQIGGCLSRLFLFFFPACVLFFLGGENLQKSVQSRVWTGGLEVPPTRARDSKPQPTNTRPPCKGCLTNKQNERTARNNKNSNPAWIG